MANKDLRCGLSLDPMFMDESVKRISFPRISLAHDSPYTMATNSKGQLRHRGDASQTALPKK